MKKRMLIGWVTIFILFAIGTPCFAFWATNVADTTKQGSFLIFPLIKAGTAQNHVDTVVSISNDYASPVTIQCYYKYPQETQACLCEDFIFTLTAYQEISFSVTTGLNYDTGPIPRNIVIPAFKAGEIGELKCFAVDNISNRRPIAFNYLKGEATINEGLNMTWQYSAWRFAVGNGITTGKLVVDANGASVKGHLPLTGTSKSYDACPSRLIFPFIQNTQTYALGAPFNTFKNANGGFYQSVENTLTLVPCKQDCVSGQEGNNTITNVELMVYDEYENGLSGAWACVGCADANFYTESLRSSKLHNPSVFTTNALPAQGGPPGKIIVARGRAMCSPPADCNGTVAVPVIGVMSHQFVSPTGPIAGETPTSSPYFNPGDNKTLYGQGWLLDCHGGNTTQAVSFTYQ